MSDGCAEDRLLPLAEAVAAALALVEPVRDAETVPLLDAYSRVLAADVLARLDTPPADHSAMDGFALFLADVHPDQPTRLPVVGSALAGHPYQSAVPRGAVVRITTGAVVPTGPDAVVMQEQCVIAPDETWIELQPTTAARLRPGENIRRRGEDVTAGALLLGRGRQLRPQDVALAAGQGLTTLSVWRRPRVAVASTGDELQEPGTILANGAIYESNRYALIGLLRRLGCAVTDLGIVHDDPLALRTTLRAAAADHDVLLTSGGVSVGTADWVKDVIADLGQIAFWRLAIKPGKPVACGRIGSCLTLGLPGNPVSVMVAFLLFARPLLLKLLGRPPVAPLRMRVMADFALRRKPGRREWLRARLHADDPHGPLVRVYHTHSSGAISSLAWAEGLVELPEACADVVPGDPVDYLPFVGLGMED
ncbi:MAG: gephyrin-like molybdotransferase Glp [Candidatus Contendobacter sp.]